jgi:Arc/MetJ-type ribon-helix-helix transcriptional regulator
VCQIETFCGEMCRAPIIDSESAPYHTEFEEAQSMKAPVSLRLDSKTRRKIAQVARQMDISNSEVIRRALRSWAKFIDSSDSPYEMLADLIGVVKGRNSKRSENSGKQFRKIRTKKRKRA